MFMEPFTGPISGLIQNITGGSTMASVEGLGALGVPENAAMTAGAFAMMPGWVIAAIFNNFGL